MKIIVLLLSFSSLAFSKIHIISNNKELKLMTITKKELADLYLKKTHSIRGIRVIPLDNKSNFQEFYQQIVQKSSKELRAYWAREMYKSDRLPPKKLSIQQIKTMIKSNKNYISYSSSNISEANTIAIR
jgi:ABC-type phosphate transport system substrate-binding protein